MHQAKTAVVAAAALAAVLCGTPAAAVELSQVAEAGYFFVGGEYVPAPAGGQIMRGQMYVQYQIPRDRRHREPVIMIHGTGQTGINFLATPDGRPGWAEDFLAQGYAVYVVDQPGRGRSGQFPEIYGRYSRFSAEQIEQMFTAPALHGLWPQARLHTQWPGGPGVRGNPSFDQYYASTLESVADPAATEALVLAANLALLERVGPAVLLTHSQSGVFGWKLADERPDLVRAIIAVEPNGPPFRDAAMVGGTDWYQESPAPARPWGVTRLPLRFEPPAADPAELRAVRQDAPDGPGLLRCWLQAEPARRLPNLAGIPVAVVTGEASFRATYDHCTARFLAQAGAAVEHIRLEREGVRGNGHMMMLEANSSGVARVLAAWLASRGARPAGAAPSPATIRR